MSCPNDIVYELLLRDLSDAGWTITKAKRIEVNVPAGYVAKKFEPFQFEVEMERERGFFTEYDLDIIASRASRQSKLKFGVMCERGKLKVVASVK